MHPHAEAALGNEKLVVDCDKARPRKNSSPPTYCEVHDPWNNRASGDNRYENDDRYRRWRICIVGLLHVFFAERQSPLTPDRGWTPTSELIVEWS